MASYWRALCLAGIVSLSFGILVYIQSLPRPGEYATLPPYVPAVGAGLVAFCGMTTLLAIWCLIRRQKGTDGRLLITAGAPPGLYLVSAMAYAVFAIVINDPGAQLGYVQLYLGTLVLCMINPAVWIVAGMGLIWLDRRQKRAASSPVSEVYSTESRKWPPLTG